MFSIGVVYPGFPSLCVVVDGCRGNRMLSLFNVKRGAFDRFFLGFGED